ncbi:MAG: hypothetical protein IT287_00145 [Bdellovibrionaceae bacterium]|nr:hypothetical protein [Pseudobdellovibrionaceae bacterium]
MKSVLILTVLMCSLNVFAEADIATAKTEMTANLDKRITNLQEAKNCVSNAASKEDMKKCHEALKEDRMEMRQERLGKKEARLKERLQKVEEKKAAGAH